MKTIQQKLEDIKKRQHLLELELKNLQNNPHNLPMPQYEDPNNPLVKFRNHWLQETVKAIMLKSGEYIDGSKKNDSTGYHGMPVESMLGHIVGEIIHAFCDRAEGSTAEMRIADIMKDKYPKQFRFLDRIRQLLNGDVEESKIIKILENEFPINMLAALK